MPTSEASSVNSHLSNRIVQQANVAIPSRADRIATLSSSSPMTPQNRTSLESQSVHNADAQCAVTFEDLLEQSTDFLSAGAPKEAIDYISSRRLLDPTPSNELFNFEGMVYNKDEQPRSYEKKTTPIPLTNKNTSSKQSTDNITMDMLVLDRLGPVLLNLRNEALKEFMEITARMDSISSVIFQFTNLRMIPMQKKTKDRKSVV